MQERLMHRTSPKTPLTRAPVDKGRIKGRSPIQGPLPPCCTTTKVNTTIHLTTGSCLRVAPPYPAPTTTHEPATYHLWGCPRREPSRTTSRRQRRCPRSTGRRRVCPWD